MDTKHDAAAFRKGCEDGYHKRPQTSDDPWYVRGHNALSENPELSEVAGEVVRDFGLMCHFCDSAPEGLRRFAGELLMALRAPSEMATRESAMKAMVARLRDEREGGNTNLVDHFGKPSP